MVDLIQTEPVVPEKPEMDEAEENMLQEIPGPEEVSQSSPSTARTFVSAVSVALGLEDHVERIKREFEQTGK